MPTHSTSVLIIRLDAIGDALALAPLIAALRARGILPDIVLTHANVDAFAPGTFGRIYIAPFDLRDDSAQNREAIDIFGRELHTREYSHVLVPTEDVSGYRLAAATGAPHRIGFHNGWGKPFKTLMIRRMLNHAIFRTAGLDAAAPHECEVLFKLGEPLVDGVPTRDAAVLKPLVCAQDDGASRLTVQLTDKYERLGISADDVRTMLQEIAQVEPPRLIASAREASYARAIAGDAHVETFSSVPQWKAAIAGARAYVAPDSGGIHVAGMCGVPTLALFPSQPHLDRQIARWHPWAAPYRIVETDAQWPLRVASELEQLLV